MTRTIKRALSDARGEVDRFHRRSLSQGHTPGEETLTDVLLVECGDTVRYAKFNKPQEGRTGADWLWWFVDGTSGECFGMLVQAKCLHKEPNDRWSIDLAYGKPRGKQVESLLAAAERFQVPACYVLYCGDDQHRDGFACDHGGVGCRSCREKSVAVLAGPIAGRLVQHELNQKRLDNWNPKWGAEPGVRMSIPLERIVDRRMKQGLAAFGVMPTELAIQIAEPANDARSIASFIFGQLVAHRMTMFERVSHEGLDRTIESGPDGRVFSEETLANQAQSFELEYSYQGLRSRLPTDVTSALAGDQDDLDGFDNLAGIAVFERPRNQAT